MGGKAEGFSGTCMKDTWTKPKRGRIKGGKRGWLGLGGVVGGKWRQLYLNNNKKCFLKKKTVHSMEQEQHSQELLRGSKQERAAWCCTKIEEARN